MTNIRQLAGGEILPIAKSQRFVLEHPILTADDLGGSLTINLKKTSDDSDIDVITLNVNIGAYIPLGHRITFQADVDCYLTVASGAVLTWTNSYFEAK